MTMMMMMMMMTARPTIKTEEMVQSCCIMHLQKTDQDGKK